MNQKQETAMHSIDLVTTLLEKRWTFVVSFVLVFFLSFSVLNTVGLVPEGDVATNSEERIASASSSSQGDAPVSNAIDATPTRVVIDSVGVDVDIQNPVSRDIGVLDAALLEGAVRYPGSGNLHDATNMFLFGHSSFLPAVNNKNFRAFNDLQKVEKGDLIRVESSDAVNVYRVTQVELVSADEALVALGGSEKKLTLSTCNSFGDPGDRFVVEASFVGSERL